MDNLNYILPTLAIGLLLLAVTIDKHTPKEDEEETHESGYKSKDSEVNSQSSNTKDV